MQAAHALERVLWCLGIGALLGAATARLDGAWFQLVEQRRFATAAPAGGVREAAELATPRFPDLSDAEASPDTSRWSALRMRTFAAGAAEAPRSVGLLEISAIDLRAVIVLGTDALSLNRGIGHIPGTALPGYEGNVGLAAHRDGFFRRLGELVPGDRIVLTTKQGTREYAVESGEVVSPDAVHLLAEDGTSVLTLVTCHPFRYVGSAPERFVVRASSARDRPLAASP